MSTTSTQVKAALGLATLCGWALLGCGRAAQAPATGDGGSLASGDSAAAQAVVDAARARFVLDLSDGESAGGSKRPMLGPARAHSLAPSGGRLAATLDGSEISVGLSADQPLLVTAQAERVTAQLALVGATAAAAETTGGYVVFRQAYAGDVDVIARPTDHGLEDYLIFNQAPATESVDYALSLAQVSGVRVVSNAIELLDSQGVPRLRMARPYLVDASGNVVLAQVSVSGCAVDRNPAPPWNRPPTSPGAACNVHIAWSSPSLSYPAMLDPAWNTADSMANGRDHHTVALVPGPGALAIGGVYGGGSPVSSELFSTRFSSWTYTGDLNAARYRHTSSVLPDGRVLVAGGSFSYSPDAAEASAEVYDPITGVWTTTGSMHFARSGHTASVLADGRVLVTGGADEQLGGESYTTELWDPATDSWTFGPAMNQGRADHSATTLKDGRILVAGGYLPEPFTPLSSCELYDPVANSWTLQNPLLIPRAKHSAVLMPDGRVVVVGGEYAEGTASDIADDSEIGTPASGSLLTWTPGPSCEVPSLCHRFDMGVAVDDFGMPYFIGGDGGGSDGLPYSAYITTIDTTVLPYAFTAQPLMEAGIRPGTVVAPDGRVLIIGGRTGLGLGDDKVTSQPSNQTLALYQQPLAADRTDYAVGQPMEMLYSLPAATGALDFVDILDATNGSLVQRVKTLGKTSGSLNFAVQRAGVFIGRAFHVVDDSTPPTALGDSQLFTVAPLSPATVTTDLSTYGAGQPIVVSFSGMSGVLSEVVGIAPQSDPTSPVVLRYTMAKPSGSMSFNYLAPGQYVAVAYAFDLKASRGQSAAFLITP